MKWVRRLYNKISKNSQSASKILRVKETDCHWRCRKKLRNNSGNNLFKPAVIALTNVARRGGRGIANLLSTWLCWRLTQSALLRCSDGYSL